ncbi:cytochrome c [Gluconacetobacter sp. 1b LMG 1731]|uniref:Cytochrome c n=2 Tax=Gluconacetobacter dulcium TaxID=2729096 RepID=A0A7W4NS40_9PROT|nr:cytochrome c [Gluconacetobacter dulcium]MBB2164127.1 cytochrome c [Gluconacetobacter dulcium]MBB2192831.1 cytochrome c [Gluconacetobacter dulcium]
MPRTPFARLMRSRVFHAAALSIASASPLHAARPVAAPVPSFTAEQAQHGADLYQTACAMCHGADLNGNFQTPSLKGRLVANWAGTPLSRLTGYIQRAMPLMAPGTLSTEDATALVAFLLHENGAAPGKSPLPAVEKRQAFLKFPALAIGPDKSSAK